MPEFCSVEREGPLTIVTIERPDVMNSLHPPAQAELAAVFDEFVADPGSVGCHHYRRWRSGIQRWK